MESIVFVARGHKNITGKHRNTLEFTKDKDLSLAGDCIVGVDSDFSLKDIEKVLTWDYAKMTIRIGDKEGEIKGKVNKGFSSQDEIVLRITEYTSERTLMIRCDKAAKDLDRELIEKMKNDDQSIEVVIDKI